MADTPDPTDVIAQFMAEYRQQDPGATPDVYDHEEASDVLARLAAEGLRIVPEVDDDTRRELVERLEVIAMEFDERAEDAQESGFSLAVAVVPALRRRSTDLRTAASIVLGEFNNGK